MYKVMLFNTPDETWVDEAKGCINLYSLSDVVINPNQIGFLRFGKFSYAFDKDVLAIGHINKRLVNGEPIKLYYPNGFKLTGNSNISVTVDNRGSSELHIFKGQYIATLRLMTTQFYELMRRKDGSDKGLRPAYVKIEFYGNGK